MPCEHKDFIAQVNVSRLTDIGRYTADVTIKCAECGIPFRFIGLPVGLDVNGAAVSVDRLEARLAIAPKGDDIPDFKGVRGFTIKPLNRG